MSFFDKYVILMTNTHMWSTNCKVRMFTLNSYTVNLTKFTKRINSKLSRESFNQNLLISKIFSIRSNASMGGFSSIAKTIVSKLFFYLKSLPWFKCLVKDLITIPPREISNSLPFYKTSMTPTICLDCRNQERFTLSFYDKRSSKQRQDGT